MVEAEKLIDTMGQPTFVLMPTIVECDACPKRALVKDTVLGFRYCCECFYVLVVNPKGSN